MSMYFISYSRTELLTFLDDKNASYFSRYQCLMAFCDNNEPVFVLVSGFRLPISTE